MFEDEKKEPEVVQVDHGSHAGCPLESACTLLMENVQKLSFEEQVALIASKNVFCYLVQRDADVVLDMLGNMAAGNPTFFPVYLILAQMINRGEIKCACRRNEREEAAESAA